MKSKILIVILCFNLFVLGCKTEEKLSFSEINITTEKNTIVEVNIQNAIGDSDLVVKTNKVIANYIISSLQIGGLEDQNSLSIEESINAFNNEFELFKTDFPDSSQKWEAQIDGEITYQSDDLISYALTSYVNTGGAHGNLVISFLNIDPLSGEDIGTDVLFTNIDAVKTLAKSYFIKEIEAENIDAADNFEFKLPANIAYNDEGVIFLFNTYEVTSYSLGITEFTIPFEKISEYLKFNPL